VIKVEQLERWYDNGDKLWFAFKLARVKPKLRAKLQAKLENEGKALAEAIREAAPEDEGDLRESVRCEPDPKRYPGVVVVIGGTPETMKPFDGGVFDEALGLEYGTTKRAAHPFVWPTVQRERDGIESRAGAEVGEDPESFE
jgi:hypothetical protein